MNETPRADESGTPTSAASHSEQPASDPAGSGDPPQPTPPVSGLVSILNKAEVLSEEEWLALHRTTIKDELLIVSASEIATALGRNSYESAFTLYHRKRGDLEPFLGNISTECGHALEPVIDRRYKMATGRDTVDPGPYTIFRHEDLPWLIVTPDRFDMDLRAVELKAPGGYSRKDWKDGKGPIEFQIQNQMQLAVIGLDHGSLAAIVANREFFYHDFDRHDRAIRLILDKVKEFRERVLNGDPPDPGGSGSSTLTLKLLHPKDNGETVFNDRLSPYIKERLKLKEQIKGLKDDLGTIENFIKADIGENSFVVAEGRKMSLLWQKKRGHYTKKQEYRVLRDAK